MKKIDGNEMKITSDALIDLLYKPMTDIKMIETLDALGLEQPMIDEEYEEKKKISVKDRENSGLTFVFRELDGYSKDGEPCLSQIDFSNAGTVLFPYGLEASDNYSSCCSKLNAKATYINKWMKKSKIWIKSTKNDVKFSIAIHFTDNDFTSIRSVVIVDFDESRVGDILIENKD